MRTGMGGRTVIELSLDSAVITKGTRGELPEHGIRTGDIVRVGEKPKDGAKKRDVEATKGRGVEGVVVRVGDRSVQIALGKDGGKDEGDGVGLPSDGKLWL